MFAHWLASSVTETDLINAPAFWLTFGFVLCVIIAREMKYEFEIHLPIANQEFLYRVLDVERRIPMNGYPAAADGHFKPLSEQLEKVRASESQLSSQQPALENIDEIIIRERGAEPPINQSGLEILRERVKAFQKQHALLCLTFEAPLHEAVNYRSTALYLRNAYQKIMGKLSWLERTKIEAIPTPDGELALKDIEKVEINDDKQWALLSVPFFVLAVAIIGMALFYGAAKYTSGWLQTYGLTISFILLLACIHWITSGFGRIVDVLFVNKPLIDRIEYTLVARTKTSRKKLTLIRTEGGPFAPPDAIVRGKVLLERLISYAS